MEGKGKGKKRGQSYSGACEGTTDPADSRRIEEMTPLLGPMVLRIVLVRARLCKTLCSNSKWCCRIMAILWCAYLPFTTRCSATSSQNQGSFIEHGDYIINGNIVNKPF